MQEQPPGPAIYQQPQGGDMNLGEAPGSSPVNGITIRYLRNTPEDAQFAAGMVVDSFRGKVAHNVTEAKIPIAKKIMTAGHLNQYDSFYNRYLVAEYQGTGVGVCQLKFKGDKERDTDDHVSELGCWHACRFACFGMKMTTSVDELHQCLVDHIGVDVSMRGKGVGKLLLERSEYEARKRGCTMMFLYVTTDNRARSLYERQGYRVTDRNSICGCLGCCIGPPGSVYRMEKNL